MNRENLSTLHDVLQAIQPFVELARSTLAELEVQASWHDDSEVSAKSFARPITFGHMRQLVRVWESRWNLKAARGED